MRLPTLVLPGLVSAMLFTSALFAQEIAIVTGPTGQPQPVISLEEAELKVPVDAPAVPDSESDSPLSAAVETPQTEDVDQSEFFVGIEDGDTVSGIVKIGPNLTKLPNIQKVAYYLNGTQSGKVFISPFLWGGVNGNGTVGFNTNTLPNGEYTLTMVYTLPGGCQPTCNDHTVKVKFNVDREPPVIEEPTPDPKKPTPPKKIKKKKKHDKKHHCVVKKKKKHDDDKKKVSKSKKICKVKVVKRDRSDSKKCVIKCQSTKKAKKAVTKSKPKPKKVEKKCPPKKVVKKAAPKKAPAVKKAAPKKAAPAKKSCPVKRKR